MKRSLDLISEAFERYGSRMVVANSLGKDSATVWHLAKRVSPSIGGFIVTTRHNAQDYRSLGCAPCTQIRAGPDERAGRWVGTSKCGGECGIHTQAVEGRCRRSSLR